MDKRKTLINYVSLMLEWDYELNNDLNPQELTAGSNKKAWWKCIKFGHKWQAAICDRTRKDSTGCPYCAGQKVLKGHNDLATKYPEAVKQWHPTKNGELKPTQVMGGSGKKVWWICEKGHEFEQSISARTQHLSSCPICSGQKILEGYNDLASQYPDIAKEWDYSKNGDRTPKNTAGGSNKKFWWKCSKCGHEWQVRVADRTRDNTGCPACANKVLVVGFNDLATKFPSIAKEWHPTKNGDITPKNVRANELKKVWWKCSKGHDFLQSINLRTKRKQGCPICNNQKVLTGYNDLATTHPEIAKQWHPTKNANLTPQQVTKDSEQKVWWYCPKCGGKWQATVYDKTRKNSTGCPYCAGQKALEGHNDLASKYPEIAKEWNYEKNGNITPKDITWGSNKKFWWKCSKCGHEWQARIADRTKDNTACPACANKVLIVGFNDSATKFPEVAKEWHPTKNGNLKPTDVMAGSSKKVWWICDKGHEFEQSIDNRTSKGQSCPYCSGRKAMKGFNDFETKFPEIAKEWHTTKNGALKPSDVTYGSGQKVWWKCPIGHEYQAIVRDRGIGHTNCPICNSRNATSFPEQAIFFYVKQIYPDAINKYSEIFNTSMELDIYIPSLKLGIEYDGATWHKKEEHHKRELKKYNFCKENGIYLIRIKEQSNIKWDNVADKIYYLPKVKRNNLAGLEEILTSLLEKLNSLEKVDIDLKRDKYEILKYVYKIDNSLADKRPDVAKKWNYEKNGYLKPDMFSVSSNEIVWWKCPDCGNEWETSINHMTRKGTYGCPICANVQSGKTFTKGVVAKVGSLAEKMPELAKEWHPTKNGDLTPYDITTGRFKTVWWLCSKCGYEWQASPNIRKRGIGCPCCSGRVPKIGVNDLETTHPDVAKEWNYKKNGELTPSMFKSGSGKKVWWTCPECGNEYQSVIRRRTDKDKPSGCPICGHKKAAKSFSFKVNMLDIYTNQIVRTFDSLSEASKTMHTTTASISKVCNGQKEQAGGYKWEYAKQN